MADRLRVDRASKLGPILKTNAWSNWSFQADAPNDMTWAQVRLQTNPTGDGTVSWDDVGFYANRAAAQSLMSVVWRHIRNAGAVIAILAGTLAVGAALSVAAIWRDFDRVSGGTAAVDGLIKKHWMFMDRVAGCSRCDGGLPLA